MGMLLSRWVTTLPKPTLGGIETVMENCPNASLRKGTKCNEVSLPRNFEALDCKTICKRGGGGLHTIMQLHEETGNMHHRYI